MALGEIYNLTKKLNDGSRGNQHTEARAKVAPATKPPNTARAIADKTGVPPWNPRHSPACAWSDWRA